LVQQLASFSDFIIDMELSSSQQVEAFESHIPQDCKDTESIISQKCRLTGIPIVEKTKTVKSKYVVNIFLIVRKRK